jgi:lipid II:glycine glycyltransferase (peptidoglycan interpeptide bridge formation enzyme)
VTFQVDETCDRAGWDAFVSAHPAGNLMQSFGWGEFQRSLGWEPRYASMRAGGEMTGAALLLSKKVPALSTRVFYAPRGPVLDFADSAAVADFFEGVEDYVRRERGVFFRCDPYWTEDGFPDNASLPKGLSRIARDWSYWNLPRFVFWLDLTGSEDEVMARMTSRCRNDVRRGYKNQVHFDFGSEDDLPEFHQLMALTARHKEIAYRGIDYYRGLMGVVSQSAQVKMFMGRLEGAAITTGMSAVYGDKAWLLYAASAPSSYKLRANRTLQWEMIKWAHGEGCVRYDFRGTATNDPPSKDDPGYGVYQFKKSFGPEFTRLAGYYDLVNRPLLYRALRAAEERGLPAAYRVKTWLQELR